MASSAASIAGPTEPEVLSSLLTGGVQPSLAQVVDTARELSDGADRLCERRDGESLEQARTAWRKAYLAWRRATPFLFGPGAKLDGFLGKSTTEAVLDAAVTSDEYRDMRKRPDVRGYAGAEYMLFAPADAAAATAADRCAHLRDVAGEIAERTSQVKQEWDRGFGDMFTSAGDGKPFLIPGDALSIALAEDVNATERLLRDQISIPSGYFEGGAKPERLAAWRSNSTRDAFLATLEGFRAALAAGGSASFADLVATRDGLVSKRDPALAAAIRKQLGTIKEEIADLGGRDLVLYNELKRKPAMLKDLYDRIQVLQEQLIEASLVLELDVRSPVETQGK